MVVNDIKTLQTIFNINQLTGFYMIGTNREPTAACNSHNKQFFQSQYLFF